MHYDPDYKQLGLKILHSDPETRSQSVEPGEVLSFSVYFLDFFSFFIYLEKVRILFDSEKWALCYKRLRGPTKIFVVMFTKPYVFPVKTVLDAFPWIRCYVLEWFLGLRMIIFNMYSNHFIQCQAAGAKRADKTAHSFQMRLTRNECMLACCTAFYTALLSLCVIVRCYVTIQMFLPLRQL